MIVNNLPLGKYEFISFAVFSGNCLAVPTRKFLFKRRKKNHFSIE